MKAYTEYKRMNSIAATRIRLGISQEMFAMELGVSRSMVSKAENRTRSLPMPAMLKLAALELSLATEVTDKAVDAVGTAADRPSFTFRQTLAMVRTVGRCSSEIERLKEQLYKLETEHFKIQLGLKQVELMEMPGDSAVARVDPRYLPMRRYKLLKKLQKCGPPAQEILKNKVLLLTAAATLEMNLATQIQDIMAGTPGSKPTENDNTALQTVQPQSSTQN